MDILKVTGEIIGKGNTLSTITANPDTKSIDILGCKFDPKSLLLLSDWLELFLQETSENITLNYLPYKASPFGHGYFNMGSFPLKILNVYWNSLYGSFGGKYNNLGKTLSVVQEFNFNIEGTGSTLAFHADFNKGEIQIMERFWDYEPYLEFQPIIAWIDNYILRGKTHLIIHFKLWCFNTPMSLVIKHFFSYIMDANIKIDILWYYQEDDPDIKEAGIMYKTEFGFSDETFRLVEYKID